MESGTVNPGEISPPVELGMQAGEEAHSRPSGSNKRARADEDLRDDDEDDDLDSVFEQDPNYVEASSQTGPERPGSNKTRQRTASNTSNGEPRERKSIPIEYIQDKSRRHITFSKRKAGIMKKAYELSTLTGTQVLLLVVSETGLVYTFTTPKLSAIVNEDHGQRLIEACLQAEEGQLPAFAQHDFGIAEPSLTIKRSNGDRSPRRRQVSGQGRPTTPGSEGRRTSARHQPPTTSAPLPPVTTMTATHVSMPSPRRAHSSPHLVHMPPQGSPHVTSMPTAHLHHNQGMSQPSSQEHLNALYEQMAASSAAQSHSLNAPMSIPPYFTDGGYNRPSQVNHPQWEH